jgi:hypothetical protein
MKRKIDGGQGEEREMWGTQKRRRGSETKKNI